MSITMYPVSSTNLNAIGYEADSAILRVEFTSGSTYEYYEVPVTVFDELMNAEGYHGEFFSKFIKGQYAYQKIN